MTVLDKIKSFFKGSKPQVRSEEAKPAAKGTEGEGAKATESKPSGTGEQKGAGGT